MPKPPAHHTPPAPFFHFKDAPIKSCPSCLSALNSTQGDFWEALDLTCVCPTSQAPQLPSCSFPFELITEIKAKTQAERFANSSSLFLQTAFVVTLLHKCTQADKHHGICAGNSREWLTANPAQPRTSHPLRDIANHRVTSHRSFKVGVEEGNQAGEKMPRAVRKDSCP